MMRAAACHHSLVELRWQTCIALVEGCLHTASYRATISDAGKIVASARHRQLSQFFEHSTIKRLWTSHWWLGLMRCMYHFLRLTRVAFMLILGQGRYTSGWLALLRPLILVVRAYVAGRVVGLPIFELLHRVFLTMQVAWACWEQNCSLLRILV